MTVFSVRRRGAATRPRHTVFISCADGHDAVLPVYRVLAAAAGAELTAAGWSVAGPAVQRDDHGETAFVHRATSPDGRSYRWVFRTMSARTSPFDGTTVDAHLVVAAVEPAEDGAPRPAEWGRARAALDSAVAAVEAAGHRVHVRP